MKDLYQVACISKQALHQGRIRELKTQKATLEIFEQADALRKEHPGVGCRKLAHLLGSAGWGRDKTEALLLGNGYRISFPRNYIRTTYAQHQYAVPNRIEGMELTNINQVVQTDITYYRVKDRFYYIVFLIDVYSRRIVGHSLSRTLQARANVMALKRMVQTRSDQSLCGLIHHSDRGSQFIDRKYCSLLREYGIQTSMCRHAWENAYTERLNQTIKREYLDHWTVADYRTLSQKLNEAVRHYNTKRKHDSLNKKSPVEFEQEIGKLPMDQRPIEKIYLHSENDNPIKKKSQQ